MDPIGPGPNPLYDPAYPGGVRAKKTDAGLPPTALDQRIGYFRDAFRRDPAFEVLHFLPLYFPRAGRDELFTALKLLVRADEGIPRAPSANTQFGLAAIGSVLASTSQRNVLGEFVAALEEEWAIFLQQRWREAASGRDQTLASLQQSWTGVYGPALAPFLEEVGMSGGMVAIVPAIGVDGRVFGGSPDDKGDNVLVVSAPVQPDQGREAVYSMLREISFPMVRKVIDGTGYTAANRGDSEALASRAAIRSGALILERYLPEELMEYQRFFLTQAGRSAPAGAGTETAFREVFPLDQALEQALRKEIITK
ncbi:MAG: hypothetical protein HKO65_13615 [Gemmatimonadetes bacterium]|nr:hypothetical protein [Gemmatimonadota bacterium]NNM06121.1 hypothetical protein [Gemmatimonadota bacterium]